MRQIIRTVVCGAVVGALGIASIACTMQRTNQLPEEPGPTTGSGTPDQQPTPQPSTQPSPEVADASSPDGAKPVETKPTPIDAAPAPTGPAVTSFTLINADDDTPIANFDPIPEGTTLTLAALPSQNLNIRANTAAAVGEVIGSVAFDFDGTANFRIEGNAPYALGSDTAGDFLPLTPALAVGAHTLTATPYSDAAAAGTAGRASTLTFTVQ